MCGGAPLVVKLLQGTQGMGVVLAETKKAAESVIEAFKEVRADILVQEYIAESKGADIRCIVLGKKSSPPWSARASMANSAPISTAAARRKNFHHPRGTQDCDQGRENHGAEPRRRRSPALRTRPAGHRGEFFTRLGGIEKSTNKNCADAIIQFLENSLQEKKPKSIDGK